MNSTTKRDTNSSLSIQDKNLDNSDFKNHTDLTINDVGKEDFLFNKPTESRLDVKFDDCNESLHKNDQRTMYEFRLDSHVIRYHLYLKSQARLEYA
ncbi:hypothetical protein DSQ19_01640 [Candidatus Nitrosotenuis sp. DW1]|nr:hypothetical protein DSQ19_01640 [Candidatus Nitrosotenuis sp. DW1]